MAIDDLLDEHEQSVRVQQWLRTNGTAILMGLLIGLGLLGGWSWYQGHSANRSMANADAYATAAHAVDTDAPDAAAKVSALNDGPYKTLAQLQMAKKFVEQGQSAKAIALLKSLDVKDAQLREIVDIRLARLEIDTGAGKQALTLLQSYTSADALEVKGDAYAATSQNELARKAYADALAKLDSGSANRQVVELKLTQVGGTPAAATTENKS